MARIDPLIFGYDPTGFVISPELRAELESILGVELSDEDIRRIEESISASVGLWRERRQSPDKMRVAGHLQKIEATADMLRELISPLPYKGKPTKRAISAKDASTRFQHRYVSELQKGDADGDESHRQPIIELTANLHFISTVARAEGKRLSDLDELTSGGSGIHLDQLLTDLRPVLTRHGISTSYTSDLHTESRHSVFAKFAFAATELMPQDSRPSSADALLRRLVALIKAEKKTDTN